MKALDFRARVLFAAILPAALIAVALAWYFTSARLTDLNDELRARGLAMARQFAPAVEFGVFSDNRTLLRQLVAAAAKESDVVGVAVRNARGETLAGGGRYSFDGLSGPAEHKAQVLGEWHNALVVSAPVGRVQLDRDDLFAGNLPQTAAPPQPIGTVFIALSRAGMERRRGDLIAIAALITLVGLLLAAAAARALAAGVIDPVRQLAMVVSEIKQGNLDARASADSPGVLNDLQTGVNEMAVALRDGRDHLQGEIAAATREIKLQVERAEQANREKTQFLAAASHDLRQPLQAAVLLIGTLRAQNRDPRLSALVDHADTALGSVNGILEGLLDISRLDAGVVEPEFGAVAVGEVFRAVRATLSGLAQQSGIALRIRDSRAVCRSDFALLERIITNFVSNALIHARATRVLVGCRACGDDLRIEVHDNGVGIEPERHQDIFREFVRVGDQPRPRSGGVGLGLAIVQRLAGLLQHAIRLRSSPGKGSTFTLVVPRLARTAQILPEPRLAGPSGAGGQALAGVRILILDDDADLASALSGWLAEHAAIPMSARDVEEALALYRDTQPPQIVVSDYHLSPQLDGVRAVARLRAQWGLEVPALILSGDTTAAVRRAVSEAGLPFLNKPVSIAGLLAQLTSVLHGPRSRAK